ncbi:MAG: twin-arginine translocation signal domain-containing protein, partial [Planctomycetota bacterium]
MSLIGNREYKKKINRRGFLKKAGVGAAGVIGLPYIVPSSVLGSNGAVPPSEKIVMGFIGVGSMGGGHLRTFLGYNDVQAVAVCDLREMFRQKAKKRIDEHYGDKGCRTYDDFREILA